MVFGQGFPPRVGSVVPRWRRRLSIARLTAELAVFAAAVGLTMWSAILVKEARTAPPLAGVYREQLTQPLPEPLATSSVDLGEPAEENVTVETVAERLLSPEEAWTIDPAVRWFNGRPVRPARTMTMRVTAYSPDSRSCGDSADGLTATLHSVETNNSEIVAADPRVLPYGSLLTVPGYAGGRIVPVLDCGGKIKGNKLDLLYTTHERARKWGAKLLTVVVWEYADGKPAENPRKLR